jgi:tetrahydromethanopterin S-methyltransferase subunit G
MSVDAKLRLLENDADWLDSRIVREIGELRAEFEEYRAESRQSFSRLIGFGLTLIGGVVTGLILLVVQLAGS